MHIRVFIRFALMKNSGQISARSPNCPDSKLLMSSPVAVAVGCLENACDNLQRSRTGRSQLWCGLVPRVHTFWLAVWNVVFHKAMRSAMEVVAEVHQQFKASRQMPTKMIWKPATSVQPNLIRSEVAVAHFPRLPVNDAFGTSDFLGPELNWIVDRQKLDGVANFHMEDCSLHVGIIPTWNTCHNIMLACSLVCWLDIWLGKSANLLVRQLNNHFTQSIKYIKIWFRSWIDYHDKRNLWQAFKEQPALLVIWWERVQHYWRHYMHNCAINDFTIFTLMYWLDLVWQCDY